MWCLNFCPCVIGQCCVTSRASTSHLSRVNVSNEIGEQVSLYLSWLDINRSFVPEVDLLGLLRRLAIDVQVK